VKRIAPIPPWEERNNRPVGPGGDLTVSWLGGGGGGAGESCENYFLDTQFLSKDQGSSLCVEVSATFFGGVFVGKEEGGQGKAEG